jgi:hypothetical protein
VARSLPSSCPTSYTPGTSEAVYQRFSDGLISKLILPSGMGMFLDYNSDFALQSLGAYPGPSYL